MSNSISSRSSSLEPSQPPSTPEKSRPSLGRSASYSVAPKSEYLRNALHARRVQQSSTPSPSEAQYHIPPAPRFAEIKTPDSSPDAFAEFALTEEQMTPVSPIRRRRPSDVGVPRSKTNKELTHEIERLKETLMTSNMRVELLKKDHSKLQHELTKAKERAEALEPLEQDNLELQEENDHLRHHVEIMEDEIARLKDNNEVLQELQNENHDLRKTNEELTAIASESASHMQSQEAAIEEAVECIIKMEEEKATLTGELQQLRDRISALEMASPTPTLIEGRSMYPSRVYSVDESRPSTSHFDSDYYSQPDSPQTKSSKDTLISSAPSVRSKKFINLSEERRKSARDLVNRMSVASLKALSVRTPSPCPEVPPIPMEYRQSSPQSTVENKDHSAPLTPGRTCTGYQLMTQYATDEAPSTPTRQKHTPRQRPGSQTQGLRGLYRPEKSGKSRASLDSHPSKGRNVTPTNPASGHHHTRQLSKGDRIPTRVPSRSSGRHAYTSSSSEHLQRRNPHHRRQSEPDLQLLPDGPEANSDAPDAKLATSTLVSQPPSALSENELTSELDLHECRDRHWRDLDRLTLSQVLDQQRKDSERVNQTLSLEATDHHVGRPTKTIRDLSNKKDSAQSSSLDSLRRQAEHQERQSKTPNTSQLEKNFLFKHEDEETFLQKTRARFSLRR